MTAAFSETMKKRIRAVREAKSMTQHELAQAVGCNRSEISRLERGPGTMRLVTFLRICESMGVPASIMLDADITPRTAAEMTIGASARECDIVAELLPEIRGMSALIRAFVLTAAKDLTKQQLPITEFIEV